LPGRLRKPLEVAALIDWRKIFQRLPFSVLSRE
jgi:hypothetical protein